MLTCPVPQVRVQENLICAGLLIYFVNAYFDKELFASKVKENAMKNQTKPLVIFVALFLCTLLTACGQQATPLTGADREAVLAFSEDATDNLLEGMNANDYAMFSRDFDQDMLNAITQDKFDDLKKDRDAKVGLYISREVNSVLRQSDFYVVTYDAKFEKDEAVTVRVVFRIAEPHQVSGLWFNK
jgi:hypothetical protein